MAYAFTRYAGTRRITAERGCCDGGGIMDICCGGVTTSNVRAMGEYIAVGDDAVPAPAPAPGKSIRDLADSEPVSLASGVALTYHGYRRTGSILWALAYGALGKTFPLVAVPVALAQGFGQKKSCP